MEILNDPARPPAASARYAPAAGELRPVIDCTSGSTIVEAHRYMESSQQNGKVVVIV
jgi:NADPH:quinone reductase-like Zn-dependent oxidoreductase